jgi:hypothetical protein
MRSRTDGVGLDGAEGEARGRVVVQVHAHAAVGKRGLQRGQRGDTRRRQQRRRVRRRRQARQRLRRRQVQRRKQVRDRHQLAQASVV